MSETGYKIRNQQGVYFLTFTVMNWIDIFTRREYCNIILDSFLFCRKEKGLLLHAYVIMSNHVHIIASTESNKLSDIIRDIKTHTSKAIIQTIHEIPESRRDWMLHQFSFFGSINKKNEAYQFWKQDGNHPEELFTPEFIKQKLTYIHQNPVKAGIVSEPEHYLLSSARNYAGVESEIEVDLLW